MIDDAIVQIYVAILTKRASVYMKEDTSEEKKWINVYVGWRDVIQKSSFRSAVRGSDMRRIKKFSVEFRQDTNKIKYTRMM